MKEIYYQGTPSCQRVGTSTRIFNNFTGQYCDWKEHPITKEYDYYEITPMSETDIYNIINDNNLLDKLSPEGLNKYYAYEMPPRKL